MSKIDLLEISNAKNLNDQNEVDEVIETLKKLIEIGQKEISLYDFYDAISKFTKIELSPPYCISGNYKKYIWKYRKIIGDLKMGDTFNVSRQIIVNGEKCDIIDLN